MFLLLVASLVCAGAMHAQTATAVGVVVDSVRGRALVGATVVVSGTDAQGISDSTGRFRIDSIPPGDHTMAVLHPFLDELGIALATNKITFAPGTTTAVVLATPSADHWIARRCTDADRQEGTGAVMGRVLQVTADDPVTGALLHYTGTVLVIGKDVGIRHTTITRDASESSTGDFIVCGVPPGTSGVIRASKGRVSTGDIPVDMPGPLGVVTLRLAPNDTLATHPGVVTGRIVDNKGAPVPAARVTLRGTQQSTQATDSGTFRITGLPLGSQVLEIDKLGFPKQATSVTVIGPDQPAVVAIALLPAPPRSVEAQLVSVGFVRRKLAGKGGVFVTADTIAKLKARNVSDLQPLFPQTFMRPTSDGPILVPTSSSLARCIYYLVDGYPYQWVGPQRFNRDVPASSVVGIEYYEYGKVPQELANHFITRGFPRCSMLAIWTVNSVGAPPT